MHTLTFGGFRCRICKHRFEVKNERDVHYKTHHKGELPYNCSVCGKGFFNKTTLYGHRQLHSDTVHKCPHCDKEFPKREGYRQHILIHKDARHKCPHCPKEFVQKANLKRHIRIHTGEKPYKCLYCEKRFSDKGACNAHIKVHTREESFSCPYCDRTYWRKQRLKYHMRKHTDDLVSCDICGKSFTENFTLKIHKLVHKPSENPCQQCGKVFSREDYLKRHVRSVHQSQCALQTAPQDHIVTHSKVKQFKCLLCDKEFLFGKSLRSHLLKKHKISHKHPKYKKSFYAMAAAEVALDVPQNGLTSTHPTEVSVEDLLKHSSPEEDEEEKLQHQTVDAINSGASKACSTSPSSKTNRRSERLRKMKKRDLRKTPIQNLNEDENTASFGKEHQWTSTLGTTCNSHSGDTLQKSSNSPTRGRNSPQDLDMVVVEDDDYDTEVRIKEELDEDELYEDEDTGGQPILRRLVPLIIIRRFPSSDEESNGKNS